MVDIGSLLEVTTLDVVLIAILLVLVYRWYKRQNEPEIARDIPKPVAPLKMTDMTVDELKKYNGEDDEHILLACDRIIFDVSRSTSFYGKGGAYEKLAGHDATRALSVMDANLVKEEWDDYAGLTDDQKDTSNEWRDSFLGKYPTVGRLVEKENLKKNYEDRVAGIRSLN
ncbi:unnamed protein product [Auanema sp. JU1783]|nr:unnamed protein product [Auanema sp. JU1783]